MLSKRDILRMIDDIAFESTAYSQDYQNEWVFDELHYNTIGRGEHLFTDPEVKQRLDEVCPYFLECYYDNLEETA